MIRGMRVFGLFVASGLVLSVGCSGGTSSTSSTTGKEPTGEKLAEVNGMVIDTSEFDEAFARTMPRGPEGESQDEAARKKEVLDRLVADKVLYQEALRQGLDKDPKIQRMMINTLLRKDVYGSLKNSDISDEELQKYFDEHKDDFIVPEKVQVKRILIKVDADTPDADAQKKADTVLAEVQKNPDSFKDVAIRDSEDAYARRGGDVGFISKDGKPGLDAKVVEEAFKLEAGQLSAVFKTDEGYNVLQVVNKRERVERSFDQMKGAVLRKLKTEKSKEIQDKYIADLKKTAKITVSEDKLAAHQPKRPTPPGGGAMGPDGMPMAPTGLLPGGAPGGLPGGMPGAGAMPGGMPGAAPAGAPAAGAAPAAPAGH